MRTLLAVLISLAAASAHAQFSEKPADVIVPIVGSTRGQSNATFRTAVQLANPGGARMTGWLIFHPHAQSAAVTDPAIRYDLGPHATLSYPDVIAALNTTGFGSLDLLADDGRIPTVVARAFDDQPEGTKGVTVPAIPSTAVLSRGEDAALIAPHDPANFRFNIGVRSLESGASLNVIVRDAAGVERHRRTRDYPANYLEQTTAEDFVGTTLRANDSIGIEFVAGSAIVYGTTVDNRSNDSAMQVLRR